MGKEMTRDRIAAIVAIVMCFVLAVTLVVTSINNAQALSQKDSEIKNLTSTIDDKNTQINDLQDTVANDSTTISALNITVSNLQTQATISNEQINSLTTQTTALQKQVNDLAAIVNKTASSEITTLIFHVCEKGPGYNWGRMPNVTYTYNQILKLNNGVYNVLLLPEYEGDQNWTETFAWLKQNFANIPIVLSVFEGGSGNTPNRQLTLDQISEAVTALNVRELRIGEIASWYLSHLQPFPTNYVTSLLNFTRTHGLRMQWSEWQVNYGAFQRIQGYIAGYEDIVTVTFQTNSKELEPWDGFVLTSGMFQHWGGSIQSWYWQERGYGTEFDMPTSVLLEHTLAARKLGAEILEFEPYWYLFDNGEPRENFQVLMAVLTSA
jgi:cell division protein FtsL